MLPTLGMTADLVIRVAATPEAARIIANSPGLVVLLEAIASEEGMLFQKVPAVIGRLPIDAGFEADPAITRDALDLYYERVVTVDDQGALMDALVMTDRLARIAWVPSFMVLLPRMRQLMVTWKGQGTDVLVAVIATLSAYPEARKDLLRQGFKGIMAPLAAQASLKPYVGGFARSTGT